MTTATSTKILLIQTAFIGDVVLATPLIEELYRFFPNHEIDFLLRKGNENLLVGHPKLHKILIWDKKKSKYLHLWQLLKTIRSEKYDFVINLQRFGATGMLTAFSAAAQTIGFSKNPFSIFFSKKILHKIGSPDQKIHEVERNLQLIQHLTGNTALVRPKLYPSKQDFESIKNYQSVSYVCISPTSVWQTKQVPAERWQILINYLLDAHTHIYLLGAPSDFSVCEQIKSQSDSEQIQNLAGKLGFLQSCALMSCAAMNYVNDSAPLHFASAMNAPVTAFFCSTLPSFGFYPLSDVSFVRQIAAPLPCRPCGLHGKTNCPQGHFRCGNEIQMI